MLNDNPLQDEKAHNKLGEYYLPAEIKNKLVPPANKLGDNQELASELLKLKV